MATTPDGHQFQGSQLQIKAADGSWLVVGGMRNLSVPRNDISFNDVTTAADTVRRELPSKVDKPSDMTSDIFFRPEDPGQARIAEVYAAKTCEDFRIVFPQAIASVNTYTFEAYVQSYEVSGETDEMIDASLTLRVQTLPVASA